MKLTATLDEDNSDEAASIGCAIETLVDVLGLKIGRDQRPSGSKESELDEKRDRRADS